MIRSMTAYAAREQTSPAGRLGWELRSVNQRYLDLSLRLPEDFRALEPDIRERFKARLSRGKIEATLRFHADPASAAASLSLNTELAASLGRVLDEISRTTGTSADPDPARLLDWPGLVNQERPDVQTERRLALELLDQALDGLVEARESEGGAITAMLEDRLDRILREVTGVREQLPAIREGLERRFRDRLAAIEHPVDPGRIEQEIVLQLQKLDVDEELDRLEAHVAEIRRALDSGEPVGRRLDFLMQELNREANTLGSKATAAGTNQAAVELKVLIEQMREQVQNVE